MRGLYPEIEPYEQGMLEAGDGNRVYWETCGNPRGKPAVVLHGGPGSGCSEWHRRLFDPAVYRTVLLGQLIRHRLPTAARHERAGSRCRQDDRCYDAHDHYGIYARLCLIAAANAHYVTWWQFGSSHLRRVLRLAVFDDEADALDDRRRIANFIAARSHIVQSHPQLVTTIF